jgi:hypothetical protein
VNGNSFDERSSYLYYVLNLDSFAEGKEGNRQFVIVRFSCGRGQSVTQCDQSLISGRSRRMINIPEHDVFVFHRVAGASHLHVEKWRGKNGTVLFDSIRRSRVTSPEIDE